MKNKEEHSDAHYYEMASNEVENGLFDKSLMAKAFTKSRGDEKEAKFLYIEWRVQSEIENNPNLKKFIPILFWFIVVAYGAFSFYLSSDSNRDNERIIAGLFLFNFFIIMVCGSVFVNIKPKQKKYEHISMGASFVQLLILLCMIVAYPNDLLPISIINFVIISCFLGTMLHYRKIRIFCQKHNSNRAEV